MSAAPVLFTVDGWELARLDNDEEPRIPAAALGVKLGYERPRKIRDLIKRLCSEGKLSGVHVRPTAERTSMPRRAQRAGGQRQHDRQQVLPFPGPRRVK